MKTPKEIKKDAEICMNHSPIEPCHICKLYSECYGIPDHIIKELYDLVVHYESCLAQAERERDAAVNDLIDDGDCHYCKNLDLSDDCGCGNCCTCENDECPCCKCDRGNDHFEWRGVTEANSK